MKLKEKIRYEYDWTYLTLYEHCITNFISCQIFIIYFGARNWADVSGVGETELPYRKHTDAHTDVLS